MTDTYPRFWYAGVHENSSVLFMQLTPDSDVRCVGTEIGSKVRTSVFTPEQLSSPRIYPETTSK